MARGQKILRKPKRGTVLLEEELFEFYKKLAIAMSVKENRLVTPTEIMRDALEQYCHDALEQHCLFPVYAKEELASYKVG